MNTKAWNALPGSDVPGVAYCGFSLVLFLANVLFLFSLDIDLKCVILLFSKDERIIF